MYQDKILKNYRFLSFSFVFFNFLFFILFDNLFLLGTVALLDFMLIFVFLKKISEFKKEKLILDKRFKDIFENSAIGLAIVSIKGEFLEVNDSLCKIFSYEREELIKKTFQEITHPEDLDKDLDFVKKMLNDEIETYQMEKRYFDKSNNIVWALLTGSIVKKLDNTPDYFVAQIQDITRLKKEKFELEKFKSAVDNATDQIVITDPDGIVIYGNQAVKKTTGYDPEEAIGEKAAALWKVPQPKEYYEKMWRTIKEEKKTFISELTNKHKSGRTYVASISIYPVLDSNGEIIFFVSIERDITKEKEIDKAKTEFVSLASHQLRTPLSAIGWYTEMLLNGDAGKITKKQKQFLGEVYKGNGRMVELVNALLNVSRLDTGTLSINSEELDVIKEAQSILKEIKILADKKDLQIITDFYDTIPKIKADPNLLDIIFQNLLSNSVKYTPEKGKIEFTIDKNKKDLIIKVKDNGYGIPEHQQEKIFSKLFRADNIKIKETDGTGLGLYIVKTIIDTVGGSIGFESKEDKGTIFNVKLPLSGMKENKGIKKLI